MSKAGLLLVEHLNLDVLDRGIAEEFYCRLLGLQTDPNRPKTRSLHSNCGYLTQFHTGKAKQAQVWRGVIEIVYDSKNLQKISQNAKVEFDTKGSKRSGKPPLISKLTVLKDGHLSLSGPYGNNFLLRTPTETEAAYFEDKRYGIRKYSEKSKALGIGGITVRVKVGNARKIADFYLQVFKFPIQFAEVGKDGDSKLHRATVLASNGAQLIHFLEAKGVEATDDDGEHVAMYIGDFLGTFKRCHKLGLVWVNPRFVHLDNTKSLKEAVESQTFRIRDLKDPKTGEVLLRLEHEIRSAKWPRCPLASV